MELRRTAGIAAGVFALALVVAAANEVTLDALPS